MDKALQAVVEAKNGPLGVIATFKRKGGGGGQGGKAGVQVHTAGVSELGGGPPTQRMRMRIASTSKAFSAAVALSLIKPPLLSFDSTIAEVLPDLPAAWGPVTLRELMQHTSGLPDFSGSKEFLDALVADPLHGPKDQAKLLSYVEDEPLVFSPGSRYEYSNSDNIVIALMAEAATGKSYRQVLRQAVLKVGGLKATSLPRSAAMPTPYMRGYDPPDGNAKPEDVSEIVDPNWTGASGGLVSTPNDLRKFAGDYVGAEFFRPGPRKVRFHNLVAGTSEPPGPGRNSAGAGIFRYRTECGTVYGHTGNSFGYTQFFAATKNGKQSLTVSANQQLSPKINPDVFKLLLEADEKAVCAALAR